MDGIGKIRERIDEADREMVGLWEKRMQLCREVARLKRESGMGVRDRKREAEILESRGGMLRDPALKDYLVPVMEEILRQSRRMQENILEEEGKHV